jgi:hypothetical protein
MERRDGDGISSGKRFNENDAENVLKSTGITLSDRNHGKTKGKRRTLGI